MENIKSKIIAGRITYDIATLDIALDYISQQRPDGWCFGYPDVIRIANKAYTTHPDDRSGLRDYPAAKCVNTENPNDTRYIRLHYVLTDDMVMSLCVAWSIDD